MQGRAATRATLALAREQDHTITRRQALGLGVHPRQILAMTDSDVLAVIHPGVFAEAAYALDPLTRARATSLYVARHGLISHRTAAWLQGIVDDPGPVLHATIMATSYPRYKGIRFHLVTEMPSSLPYRAIRCTAPARTIADVAPSQTMATTDGMIDKALVLGRTRPEDLIREAAGSRRGCKLLRLSLEDLGHIGRPDASVLEAEFRRLIRRSGLPAPEVQVVAGPNGRYRVDCIWRDQRVVVELAGYAWHHSPAQMASDAARQNELTLEGLRVLTFTWRDVTREPGRVVGIIRQALEAQG